MSEDAEPLEGHLDVADWRLIAGWAFNPAKPEKPIWLECVIDDRPPVRFLANLLRADLQRDGVGTGRYGFHLSLAGPLDPTRPHEIQVRRESDGRMLRNAPRLLERAPLAGREVRAWFEGVIAAEIEAATRAGDVLPTASFLVGQIDRLLAAHADSANGRTLHDRYRRRWEDTLEGPLKPSEPMPDQRPWALVIDQALPGCAESLALVRALQRLGHRVAAVASQGLPATGARAEALATLDVTVHGRPLAFTVEDVLAREAGLYRCIVLRGLLAAAAYGVVARLHHPDARIVVCLPGATMTEQDELLAAIGMLATDDVLVPSAAMAQELGRKVPGRRQHVVDLTAPDDIVARAMQEVVG